MSNFSDRKNTGKQEKVTRELGVFNVIVTQYIFFSPILSEHKIQTYSDLKKKYHWNTYSHEIYFSSEKYLLFLSKMRWITFDHI